jgi:hypothetical protein
MKFSKVVREKKPTKLGNPWKAVPKTADEVSRVQRGSIKFVTHNALDVYYIVA